MTDNTTPETLASFSKPFTISRLKAQYKYDEQDEYIVSTTYTGGEFDTLESASEEAAKKTDKGNERYAIFKLVAVTNLPPPRATITNL